MAIYGIDFLGTAFYGEPLYLEFNATPFTATPRDYGALFLQWVHPQGDWDRIRLRRSGFGYPIDESDGTLLFDRENDSRTGLLDEHLKQGAFYYYSIFVRDIEHQVWVRAGDTMGLAIQDHGYSRRLFELMPGYFQERDQDRATTDTPQRMYDPSEVVDGVITSIYDNTGIYDSRWTYDQGTRLEPFYPEGPLERFCSVFGLALDHLRTEYDSLRWLRNPDKISGNLLRLLAQQFGLPHEPALGMRQTRVWLRDAVYLYRHKGTRPGIETAVTAITGWGSRVEYAKNLLRGESAYAWYPFLAVIDDDVSPDNTAIPTIRVSSAYADGGWKVGTTPLDHLEGDAESELKRWFGLPVEAGEPYSFTAQFWAVGASDEPTITAHMAFFDFDGQKLDADVSSTPVETSSPQWVTLTWEGVVAPEDAYYAAVYLEAVGVTEAAVQVRYLQFEHSATVTDWESARSLLIHMDPVRENFVTNPAFDESTSSWSMDSGTITRVAEGFVIRDHALRVEPAGTGVLAGGPYRIRSGGGRHVWSVYAKGEANGADPEMRVRFYDSDDVEITTGDWRQTSLDDGESKRLWGEASAPIDATWAIVEVRVHGQVLLDAAMLERGDVPGEYFDGQFFGADTLWVGNAPFDGASRYYPSRAHRNHRVRELLKDFLPIGQGYHIEYFGEPT